MIPKFDVTKELQGAVNYLKNGFGLEPTLSEIFALRRYLVEDSSRPKTSRFQEGATPMVEATARLFRDYYGLDLLNFYITDSRGQPALGSLSELVSDEGLFIREDFKEYLRRIQQDSYFP